MVDSDPSNDVESKRPIPVYARLHETAGDRSWKLIGRALQVIGAASAVASIIVLIIIQGQVNEINTKTKRVDRSLEFVRQIRTQNDSNTTLDSALHHVDLRSQELLDDKKRTDYKMSLHGFVVSLSQEEESIRAALEDDLKEYQAIVSCLHLDICDEGTLKIFLGDRIRTTYVYMRPLFLCEDYYFAAGLHQGLKTLIEKFYSDINTEYDCPEAAIASARRASS